MEVSNLFRELDASRQNSMVLVRNVAAFSLMNKLKQAKSDVVRVQNAYSNIQDKGTQYACEHLRLLLFYQDLVELIDYHLEVAEREEEDSRNRIRML